MGAPLPLNYSPSGPGPYVSGGHQVALGSTRPTREGMQIKAARGRAIFIAVAAALVVVIGLLIYFVSSSGPRPLPPPPPPSPSGVPSKVDAPPQIDSPVASNPPPPIVELPPIELQVVSSPPGAEVYVDGNLASKTPYKFQHKRGARVRIEVRKRGFDPYYEELEPDSDRTIDVSLEKSSRGGKKRNGDGGKKSETASGAGTGPAASPGASKKGDPKGSSKTGGAPAGNLPTGLRDPFRRIK